MLSLSQLYGDVLRSLREHIRPLLAYHLFFTILASAVLLPSVAWTLTTLLSQFGRPVISNAELLDILVSPGGVLWLLAAIGLTFLVLYLQQAGMILVAVRPRDNHYRLAWEAFWGSLRRLPALAALVVVQVGSHLLLVLPPVLAISWLYGVFLGGLDPYYVQRVRPPAMWQFLAVSLPLVMIWGSIAATLYFRWILALPLVVLEALSPLRALKRSHRLTRGRRRPIAAAVILLLLAIMALPFLITALFDRVFTPMLWWLPERDAVLIPAMLAYLSGYVLLTLAVTFVGIAANSLLSACLYLRLVHSEPRPPRPTADAHPGRWAWAVELGVIAFAISQAWLIVNSFELRDEVLITAHRGSSMAAPENTMAAIDQAILDGADFTEIDVRLTADDQVILYHDRSLQRLTGDPRNVRDLTMEELQQFDVGSWFGDAFVGERMPSLDDALARTRVQSPLMIDLKPDPGRELDLVDAVFESLARENQARERCREQDEIPAEGCGSEDVHDDVLMATMSPSLVREIKTREPQVRTTLLAQFVLPGTLDRSSFDALGLRHNRVSDGEIRAARYYGYELHTWTVNDRARMSQLIDMGVDNIITDRPDLLAELLHDRRELSDGALLLVKLRNWLRG
ncbi:glycerophosphoryl diester phosphodiesterase membrane domain-containing protein [Halomonas sp. ML-15]|uniref:glycerophosphodiester phosphodiesterase family protein n=1 Tax=Halomonas sp. ML-15 TaxID=2773305 RepID=UPI001746A143|nr:glycerophosphodiester phosphodiesterase family protein [Halomonas sp. ML-15]MBD3895180.1 glycerophosphoryl diester phosphodiesterase membrane domain-containing protein [Halomonas sp. ML-15]